jgi:hypothetical protein
VDNSRVNTQPIWWEVRPVLVMSQSDWPAADGSSGITSAAAMDAAEAANRAIEVGSNFFLFFSSKMSSADAASHIHMHPSSVASRQATGGGKAPSEQSEARHEENASSESREVAVRR